MPVPALTKSLLDAIAVPVFTSPIDGHTYGVTTAAMFLAQVRDLVMAGLREESPQVYARHRELELGAMVERNSTSTAIAFVHVAMDSFYRSHPMIVQARDMLEEMHRVMFPIPHADYLANRTSREFGQLVNRLTRVSFIPGL